jgi:hypothetical protein
MDLLLRAVATLVATGALMTAGSGVADAATNPAGTGQPSQTCGDAGATSRPGGSVTAPGSAFNPAGTSGTVYAGEQPQNSKNPASVSQYDVACYQVSQH